MRRLQYVKPYPSQYFNRVCMHNEIIKHKHPKNNKAVYLYHRNTKQVHLKKKENSTEVKNMRTTEENLA